MEQSLKQRLVGIAVLAAFVLLIAPVLLDAEGRIPEKITNIPPQPKRPDLSHIRSVEPSEGMIEPLPDAAPETFAIKPDDSVEEAAAEPPSSAQELWSVQVASFRDEKKASVFKNRLIDAGYNVYVREKLLSDGTLFTQVFAGPLVSKSETDRLKETIKKEFGEQGLVVRHRTN